MVSGFSHPAIVAVIWQRRVLRVSSEVMRFGVATTREHEVATTSLFVVSAFVSYKPVVMAPRPLSHQQAWAPCARNVAPLTWTKLRCVRVQIRDFAGHT